MKQLVFVIFVLCLLAALIIIVVMNRFVQPRDITLKDIPPVIAPLTNPKGPATPDTSFVNSPATDRDDKVPGDYYIIVESFRDFSLAQESTDKLIKNFGTNFIILPPTKDGYYRISYGEYSTYEEAKSTIKSIKANIRSDAWIFSVNKKTFQSDN